MTYNSAKAPTQTVLGIQQHSDYTPQGLLFRTYYQQHTSSLRNAGALLPASNRDGSRSPPQTTVNHPQNKDHGYI